MSHLPTCLPEIQVAYQRTHAQAPPTIIANSQDAYDVFRQLFDPATLELFEEFKVLYLNRRNEVIGYRNLSRGSATGTVVDIKILLAIAMSCNAQGIILAHNHPSGQLRPSHSDVELTTKIVESGTLMDVKVLDHVILTYEGYWSFADESML